MSKTLKSLTCATLAFLAGVSTAHAHAIIGDRVFPATLAVDDPGISDEINLPQVSRFKEAGDDGAAATGATTTSVEMTKRLTENLGVSVGGAWIDQDSASGLDNFSAGAKYVFFKDAPREIMLSAGVDWDIGGTGTKRIGAESFSTVTPAVFFGKGMGDLPDSMELLKPIAITGTVGYSIPTRQFTTDADSGDTTRNPESISWGFTAQYNVPYLQQHVRDLGIPKPFSTAIPIVEFAFETPTGGESSGHTTGTINPGIIFMGQEMQLGLEAQLPLNSDSGHGIGYIAQVHFYIDNIFPQSIGRPVW